jgi:aspartate-semialdehyde dehydrogenase
VSNKLKAGVIGATGMVGQRFVSLLENHPYFDVTLVAASKSSAGKTYEEAVAGRWAMTTPIPAGVKRLVVKDASNIKEISSAVDFVFCAVDMPKDAVLALEEDFARSETPVVSNNSAARNIPDVPMIIPEINPGHIEVITHQKKRLGTSRGFIVVKPNCSLQSYVPAIHPLMDFKPSKMVACTYQAISGAGKTFETWPEMKDNVIPFIGGEEEKSEKEPLKIWGSVINGSIVPAVTPLISSQCIRVPVTDGHLAAVHVTFDKKPSKDEILARWKNFSGRPQELSLPSAPKPFLTYFEDQTRPQTGLDRDIGLGMGVAIGRLREDTIFDYKFVCLSHNTIRGAAGGGVLIAELLYRDGVISAK